MFSTLARFDAILFVFINSRHTPFLDRIFLGITWFGNGWIVIPLVAVIILLKTPREFLGKALLCAAVAGTISGVLDTQIKHSVHRDRPILYFAADTTHASTVKGSVHVIGEVLKRNSFPSGHANTAFTAATILALYFGGYFCFGYLAAFFIALSRVYVGAHFPFDAVGGAVIGSIVAATVIAFFRSRKWLPGTFFDRGKHVEQ